MPVRNIPKNYRSVTGRLRTEKSQGQAAFESTLERDLLILLRFDPNVEGFEVQPLTLRYPTPNGTGERTYTPDILIQYKNTPSVLGEVKYIDQLHIDRALNIPKFRAAKIHAAAQGWHFRVFTERQIRTPRLENARFLHSYAERAIDDCDTRLVLEALSAMPEARACASDVINAVYRSPEHRAQLLPALWHLVATRRVACDLTRPLTMHSELRLETGANA